MLLWSKEEQGFLDAVNEQGRKELTVDRLAHACMGVRVACLAFLAVCLVGVAAVTNPSARRRGKSRNGPAAHPSRVPPLRPRRPTACRNLRRQGNGGGASGGRAVRVPARLGAYRAHRQALPTRIRAHYLGSRIPDRRLRRAPRPPWHGGRPRICLSAPGVLRGARTRKRYHPRIVSDDRGDGRRSRLDIRIRRHPAEARRRAALSGPRFPDEHRPHHCADVHCQGGHTQESPKEES